MMAMSIHIKDGYNFQVFPHRPHPLHDNVHGCVSHRFYVRLPIALAETKHRAYSKYYT
jgi:hypothetical protein